MKICPNCFEEIYDDSIKCMNCNNVIPKLLNTCSRCEKSDGNTIFLYQKEYCVDCANEIVNSVVVTTTNSIDGHKITKYIGIDSAEVVIGTGIWSEIMTDFQDFIGARSTDFEKKLQKAKKLTIKKIQLSAAQKGANAIVAMDLADSGEIAQ